MRRRLARFASVGVAAALLLFSCTWAFSALGLPAFAAATAAYVIAFAFAYTAQRNWTFGGRAAHGTALPRYLAVQVGCAGLAGLAAHAAAWAGWPAAAVSAFATVIASAASFFLSLTWAFAQPSRN